MKTMKDETGWKLLRTVLLIIPFFKISGNCI
mgnify:CR=1 FL=1